MEREILHDFQANLALSLRSEITLIRQLAYLETRQVLTDLGFSSTICFLVQEMKLTRLEAFELLQLAQAYNRYSRAQKNFEEGHFIKASVIKLKKHLETQIDWSRDFKENFFIKHMNIKISELEKMPEFTVSKEYKLPVFVDRRTVQGMNNLKARRGVERGIDEFLAWMMEKASQQFITERFKTPRERTVFKRAQGQCEICGSMIDLEIDHIKPKAMGGADTFDNLRLLCRRCNVRAFSMCQPLLS